MKFKIADKVKYNNEIHIIIMTKKSGDLSEQEIRKIIPMTNAKNVENIVKRVILSSFDYALLKPYPSPNPIEVHSPIIELVEEDEIVLVI